MINSRKKKYLSAFSCKLILSEIWTFYWVDIKNLGDLKVICVIVNINVENIRSKVNDDDSAAL